MSSTNLVTITGQLPAVQSQIQAILAPYYALCSVPTQDMETFQRMVSLSSALIMVVNEEGMVHLSGRLSMSKIPTLLVLEQPSTTLVQQAYLAGAKKVLIWPLQAEVLLEGLQECIPPKSIFARFRNYLSPIFSIRNLPLDTDFKPKRSNSGYKIRLLGTFSIQHGEFLVSSYTAKAQELLGYLFFNYPKTVRREKLCAALWPGIDTENARNRLNVLIHRMRKAENQDFGPSDWLQYDHRLNAYCLNLPDHTEIDILEYYSCLQELKQHQHQEEINIQICKKIVDLHNGEFLEGIEHSEWVDRQRLDIHEKLQNIVLLLVDYHLKKNLYKQAMYYCRKGVELDPCLELIQQRWILTLALQRDYEAALRAFRRFKQILLQELGLAPSASTQNLINLIEEKNSIALQQWIYHFSK